KEKKIKKGEQQDTNSPNKDSEQKPMADDNLEKNKELKKHDVHNNELKQKQVDSKKKEKQQREVVYVSNLVTQTRKRKRLRPNRGVYYDELKEAWVADTGRGKKKQRMFPPKKHGPETLEL